MAKPTTPQLSSKLFREMDKKAALLDAEEARLATLRKTEQLKLLRLAKEAEERTADAANPKGKPVRRTGKTRASANSN